MQINYSLMISKFERKVLTNSRLCDLNNNMSSEHKLPRISGKQLIRLALRDGWLIKRRARHGVALCKTYGQRSRVTVIPDSRAELDEGTLSAIIGYKQMGLGKQGLLKLIDRFGI